jgi:hypothetical protein
MGCTGRLFPDMGDRDLEMTELKSIRRDPASISRVLHGP